MEERRVKNTEEDEQVKGRKLDDKPPFCTKAPSAEHSRASDEDDPCDDSRSGDS